MSDCSNEYAHHQMEQVMDPYEEHEEHEEDVAAVSSDGQEDVEGYAQPLRNGSAHEGQYESRRSSTRPPEDRESDGDGYDVAAAKTAHAAEMDAADESMSDPAAPAPHAAAQYAGLTPSYPTSPSATRVDRRRSSVYVGAAGHSQQLHSPGHSSYRVRRSSSAVSARSSADGRLILKDNANSLVPDPRVQELRRHSFVSAARHHSARRAGSIAGSTGVGWSTGSRTSGRALSEAESVVLDIIAARDAHRVETYYRAQELDVQRSWSLLDEEIAKQRRAAAHYEASLHEREVRIRESQTARERRQRRASERRQGLEEERRRATEASIARKDELSVPDPYGPMYSNICYAALSPVRRSHGLAIAPRRSTVGETPRSPRGSNGANSLNGTHGVDKGEAHARWADADAREKAPRGRAARSPSSAARTRRAPSAPSIVEHPRGWR